MYAERANKLNEEKEREEREGKRLVPDRIPLVPQRARQDSGSGPAPGPGPQVRQEPLFHSATQRGIHQVH